MTIRFTVPGLPIAKGRPRLTTRGGFAHAYTPDKTRKAETTLAARAMEFRPASPLTGPLRVSLRFTFPVPASWSRWQRLAAMDGVFHHVTKPDCDNCIKSAIDALSGAFFIDDRQIVRLVVEKRYGEVPSTYVEIDELAQAKRQLASDGRTIITDKDCPF